MYQAEEKDWKLFRKLLPGWQEAYMERLTKEYVELLTSDRQASDKFWALDKRIKEDKRRTGVLARGVSRSNLVQLIIDLIYEEAITAQIINYPFLRYQSSSSSSFHKSSSRLYSLSSQL